ncbi:hypothetical protein EC396_11500 [Lutibacter sp. HS1-25]|nr:hypothetical protein EC396_11500 [Lutibacter sp. HS1-25]
MKKRHQQKLIVISFILVCLFNIPIVLLFSKSGSIFGFPVLYFYIFFVKLNNSIWFFNQV